MSLFLGYLTWGSQRSIARNLVVEYNGANLHITYRNIPVTQKYLAQIYVTLRPSVLDPAGTAVQSGLQHMGYDNVEGVRIGKYVELTLTAADESIAREQLDRVCDQLLANPVVENYRFDLTAIAVAVETVGA